MEKLIDWAPHFKSLALIFSNPIALFALRPSNCLRTTALLISCNWNNPGWPSIGNEARATDDIFQLKSVLLKQNESSGQKRLTVECMMNSFSDNALWNRRLAITR